MSSQLSIAKIIFYLVCFAVSVATSYLFSDQFRSTSGMSSQYIAIIISILAASLFAVISIVGDPSMLLPGSQRVAWESAKQIQKDLQSFNMLFVVYLITLGCMVVAETVAHNRMTDMYFIYNIYTFLAVFSFIASLALPFQFSSIQKMRLEDEIEARQKKRVPNTSAVA